MPDTHARTRRPRGPGRRWAPKRSLPLLLVALALVVTGVGALQAYGAQRSHRETAEALLRDYGVFAAWSFAERGSRRIHDALHATFSPVRQDLLEPDVGVLECMLAEGQRRDDGCGCGLPLAGGFAFHARPGGGPDALVFAGEAPRPAVAERQLRTGHGGHRRIVRHNHQRRFARAAGLHHEGHVPRQARLPSS